MKHSIAFGTGATYGLGHAAGRLFATEGYREVIVTGRPLARMQETSAQLAAQTKRQVFTPPELVSEVGASISSCSMPGWSQVRSACSLRRASRLLRPR